jgi:2-polyprenyl-3-methyl-5-hydroxy-6-metoxy-1,4-benzoquinol methylase
MPRAKTNAELSLSAHEFIWESEGLSEVHQWVLPRINQWLAGQRATRVLDLGCGNGAFTNALVCPGRQLTGIDASESGIALAWRSSGEARFFLASLDQPLPSALRRGFDAVVCVEVIEHLLLPRNVFRRAREALAGGGHLIITTPYHGYWKNLALAVMGKFDRHWHPLRDYGHVKFFSIPTLRRLFREEGFRVHGFVRVGRVPWLARSMIFYGQWMESLADGHWVEDPS